MLLNRLSLVILTLLGTLPCSTLSQAAQSPNISRHGISFSTGNKFISQRDISLTGPVSSLSFTRHYNSQSKENNTLGYGWSNTHDEHLRYIESHNLIILTRADGKLIHFSHNGVDAWINKTNKVAVITELDEGGFQLTPPNKTIKRYNVDGQLIEKYDRNNNAIFYTYSDGILTSISDAFGRSFSLNYNDNTRLQSLTTPIGNISYSYDDNENLTSVLQPDGTGKTYLYEDPNDVHNLTGIIDESGLRTLTVGYDSRDRVTSSAFSAGAEAVSIEYQAGYKRVVTDSLGVSSTYQLETMHGIAKVRSYTGPGCSSCGTDSGTSYTYNHRQQVISSTDALGNITTFQYDTNGNRTQITKGTGTPLEQTTSYTYHPDSSLVATISKLSIAKPDEITTSSMAYDNSGNLQSLTESGFIGTEILSRTTSYTHDSYGRITTIDGPRTDVIDISTLTYYSNTQEQGFNRGFLHTVSNSLGQTTTYSDYNVLGKAATITTPINSTTMTFDIMGRVLTRTTNGRTTSSTYDGTGSLVRVDMPGGRSVTYTNNASGQVSRVEDSMGNALVYTYDSEGQKRNQELRNHTDEIKRFISYEYDESGRLNKTIQPDASYNGQSYNEVGNLVTRINAMGQQTSYDYDALGRLTITTAPGEVSTGYSYDSHNNLSSVTDGEGRQTLFTFDDFGRKTSRTASDTGITSYQYDLAGNLISSTDANNITTSYDYDALGRVLAVHYPDSNQDVLYSYDQNGHTGLLTSMQDSTGTTSYSYDSDGRLTLEERNLDNIIFKTTYTWTDNNEPASITYPSGRVVTYNRNNIGQTTSVTTSYNGEISTIADSITNLPFGPITSMTLGNSLSIANSFDQLYRLTNVTADTLYNRDYSYQANSLVQNITDTINPDSSQSFTYDDLNRLLTAQGKYGDTSYTYDKVGNRLSHTTNTETTNYTLATDSNRLLQTSAAESIDFQYDAVGNTTQKGNTEFNWSQDNRLLSVSSQAETIGQYGYDGRGLRVKRTVAGHTLYTIYGTQGNLLLESDDQGNTLREYAYLGTNRLAMFDYTIEQEFTVNVSTSTNRNLEGVNVYGFNEQNAYTGLNQTSDDQGRALFDRDNFGDGSYTFRVDYLGSQFWSDSVVVANSNSTTVVIEEEEVEMTVTQSGTPQEGVKVYLFSESGAYLGVYATTDSEGKVVFTLPEAENYTFRADLLGSQYWSDTITIADGGSTGLIATGGGTLIFTLADNGSPLTAVKTYLFTPTGSYLGYSATSDAQGQVSYEVPEGSYTIRADFLGYQFWSEEIAVSESTSALLNIPHQPVILTVAGDLNGDIEGYANITTYLFSPSGSYLGLSQPTDVSGQVTFNLPEMEYKVRADYYGAHHWSELFAWLDSPIHIAEGTIQLEVTNLGFNVEGVATYLFSDSGSYLGVSLTTDQAGEAIYRVPAGSFSLRANYQGSYYWGDITVAAHQENPLTISTGGVDFTLSLTNGNAPLVNIKTYLFTESGTYLGESKTTDVQGQAGYAIADGSYKIRIDYLGYQYWTEVLEIPTTESLEYIIAHQDVTISAIGEYNGDQHPLSDSKLYLFTPTGSYQAISATTDDNGQAIFSLPPEEYKVRLDYLSHHYWSETFNQIDTGITLAEGIAEVTVTGNDSPLASVSVYLCSESGSYLGQSEITSTEGKVTFKVPEGTYKFRADYQSQHFRNTALITGHQNNPISLDTGGGSLTMTVFGGESTIISNVKTYLFSTAGSYLGQSATTDVQGLVSYDVAEGDYKIRVDYLGYQFWSDDVSVPGTVTGSVMIDHQDVVINVLADEGPVQNALSSVRCYLFTATDSYTGIAVDSDANGRAVISVPSASYKVRADYLGAQYWSEEFNQSNSDISIIHGDIELHVTDQFEDLSGAKVYLFSEEGSYLSRSATTDEYGNALFTVPEGSYTVRIDANGEQHWSEIIHVIAYQSNLIELEIGEILSTNNPRPLRFDGKAPVYKPMLASIGSLDGLFTRPVVEEPKTYYFISDPLGTGQLLVDEEQQVVWQADYSPFGKVDVVVDRVSYNFRFPGQYFDAETGLHYNWHRFYDPGTGRYISADPIGLDGGINLYAYVGGNPINAIDPWGLTELLPHQEYWARQRFDRWYNDNRDTSWTEGLPKCPSKIKVECDKPIDCTKGNWSSLGEANQTFHPGAKWCMRSKTSSGPGQQCCYNSNGDLITSGLGAGTPDRQSAAARNGLYSQHYFNDVRPFNDAFSLDGGVKGNYLTKYLEVRPPCQGGGVCY